MMVMPSRAWPTLWPLDRPSPQRAERGLVDDDPEFLVTERSGDRDGVSVMRARRWEAVRL